MTMQRWYVAVLVVASKIAGERLPGSAVDLQYRLVRASSDDEAYQRAMALGQQEAASYRNADGEIVSWHFLGLNDLHEVEAIELIDGVEIYSQIVRNDPASYVVAKERLSCFWSHAKKHKTAAEILGD